MPHSIPPVLRVLLIDADSGRAALLKQALLDGGYRVVAHIEHSTSLLAEVAHHDPDMIIIDTDSPDRDTLESMRTLHHEQPRPVVMFSADDERAVVERAIRAGVSAYIVDGLNGRPVKPAIEVAIARFREYQALREELSKARSSLEERKVIERAKGLLMARRNIDEEAAYQALRKLAMDRGQKLGEVARSVIDVLALIE
ncbi:MAG TPA: ANTAR domain-containing protein [Gammaproteobacteria bacterium]